MCELDLRLIGTLSGEATLSFLMFVSFHNGSPLLNEIEQ